MTFDLVAGWKGTGERFVLVDMTSRPEHRRKFQTHLHKVMHQYKYLVTKHKRKSQKKSIADTHGRLKNPPYSSPKSLASIRQGPSPMAMDEAFGPTDTVQERKTRSMLRPETETAVDLETYKLQRQTVCKASSVSHKAAVRYPKLPTCVAVRARLYRLKEVVSMASKLLHIV